jgi:glutamate-1-semialdehyde 2,1-aminomutase
MDARADQLWRRAQRVMPGKNSNVRRGAQGKALFFERSENARYFDVDGNDYIDFVAGMGPAIWGHSNAEYLAAIEEQARRLFSMPSTIAQTEAEVVLAEKIVEHVPCAEWVRFGISGSEADQLAVRIARGHTGRRFVLRFHKHYHGWIDGVSGGGLPDPGENPPLPLESPDDSAGIAPHARDDTLLIPWNDAEALKAVLERHGEDIALVLMEPVMLNFGCCPPREGYLQQVRALCDRYDVLLCFDEVFTGFRMALGGAQEVFGVTPDLVVLAKAIAGGMPLSAVAGSREVMQVLRDDTVLVGGTFNSFPLSIAAAVTNFEMLERDGGAFYRRIDDLQSTLMSGIREIGLRRGQPVFLQGPRGVFHMNFAADLDVAYTPDELIAGADWEKLAKFNEVVLGERVLIGGGSRFVVSAALSDSDIDDALDRIDMAMSALA